MGRDHVILWTARAGPVLTPSAAVWIPSCAHGPQCLEELGTDDDSGEGFTSVVERRLDQGEQVAVVVGGFRGRNGLWQLNVTPALGLQEHHDKTILLWGANRLTGRLSPKSC